MKCNGISLAIRDPAFRDIIRQQRLDSPSNLAREISQAAMGLAKSCWNMDHPVRALTVTALSLVPEEEVSAQLDLLAFGQDKKRERLEKLEETMDSIRAKYGKSSISHASSTQAAGGSGHAPRLEAPGHIWRRSSIQQGHGGEPMPCLFLLSSTS